MTFDGIETPPDESGSSAGGIPRRALCASDLREDFGPHSALDRLVEFEPGHIPGPALFAWQRELSEMPGRPVDPNPPQCLSRCFRDAVFSKTETLRAA